MRVERKARRLELHRETVRSLEDRDLRAALGALPSDLASQCSTASACCCPADF